MLNPKDNPLRREMMIYSFVCLTLVIIGIVGAISYKLDENVEVLMSSLTALMSGLGVALAGSLKKDLYDHMTAIENLLNMRCRIEKLCKP